MSLLKLSTAQNSLQNCPVHLAIRPKNLLNEPMCLFIRVKLVIQSIKFTISQVNVLSVDHKGVKNHQ